MPAHECHTPWKAIVAFSGEHDFRSKKGKFSLNGFLKPEVDLDKLSNILKAFNEQFGTLFKDTDRIFRRIQEDIAPQVAADPSYKNAVENTPAAARIEHDKALQRVMLTLLKDDTQVYKQFVENEAFRRAISDFVFNITSAA